MDLGLLHAPPTTMLLSILGFSLSIAGVDFAKRRAGHRALARLSQSVGPPLDYSPRLNIVERATNPVVEPKTVVPAAKIAKLPRTTLAIATLPLAAFLPLPKPTPRMPQARECRNTSVSWWQEDRHSG
jgi:hypothetical protein